MRKPILFIQGAGNKHKPLGSGKLIAYLQEQLGSDYHVLAPDMPDPDHPRYLTWRDQIEQELDKLAADVLLIGHSLGGSMLLKYLAEGTYQRPIAGMFLVAVPYWGKQDWELEYAVPEDFASHLPPIRHLFLYHSRSDEEVRFLLFGAIKNNCPGQPSECSMGRSILSQKGCLCSLKTSSAWNPESSCGSSQASPSYTLDSTHFAG